MKKKKWNHHPVRGSFSHVTRSLWTLLKGIIFVPSLRVWLAPSVVSRAQRFSSKVHWRTFEQPGKTGGVRCHHFPWRIHGTIVYLPTWMVDLYGINVGKYTSPMDPMGFKVQVSKEKHWVDMEKMKHQWSFLVVLLYKWVVYPLLWKTFWMMSFFLNISPQLPTYLKSHL